MHRLNRTEYANAIRDLLALDIDVTELLPSDGANFGFDNIASALGTSPLAARAVSDGCAAHQYDGRRRSGRAPGHDGVPDQPRVQPEPARRRSPARHTRRHGRDATSSPPTPSTSCSDVWSAESKRATPASRATRHRTRSSSRSTAKRSSPRKSVARQITRVQAKDMNEAKALIDARMTGKVFVTAGPHDVGFTWKERPTRRQDVWQPALRDSQEVHMIGGLARLKTVGVEGPYDVKGVSTSASRERALRVQADVGGRRDRVRREDFHQPHATRLPSSCDGGRRRSADGVLQAGTRRATRSSTLESVSVWRACSPARRSCIASSAIQSACVPASRTRSATSSSRRGCRSSCGAAFPDQTLMDLAVAGRLRQPGVLAAQVKRMIADERADALINNFTGQWLQLRNLESKVAPDLLMFPDFDDNIRKAFRRETELFFGYVLRENRSAMELLSADYTFVNERLAKHYGIPGVYGSRFRQVKIADPNRRGLLGQGSILSLTSVATRTSPVFRGKFILTTFLNTPPPPPLPNVPTLEESNKDAAPEDGAGAAGASPAATPSARRATGSSIRPDLRSRSSTRSGSGAR